MKKLVVPNVLDTLAALNLFSMLIDEYNNSLYLEPENVMLYRNVLVDFLLKIHTEDDYTNPVNISDDPNENNLGNKKEFCYEY